MALDIHNMVVQIIGELPNQYHFVYAIGDIAIFIMIIYCVFVVPYKLLFERW